MGNYLIHRSDERKDHKYVARVRLKKQTKNKKYRYFYDLDAYKAYMKKLDGDKAKKESIKDNKSKIEFFIEEKFNDALESFPKLTDKDEKIKNIVSDNKEKTVKAYMKKLDGDKAKKESIKDNKSKIEFFIEEKFNDALESLPKITSKDEKVKKIISDNKEKTVKELKEGSKYLKTNDETSYEEYQKNEPDFMKNVREIKQPTTKEYDMSEINELYDPNDPGRSENCAICSTAYELRRRGYDVEAISNSDGLTFWHFEFMYENPEIVHCDPNGEVLSLSEYTKDLEKGPTRLWQEHYNVYEEEEDYYSNSETIEKTIAEQSGKNTRGNLLVFWNGGGGHSMVYEVDEDGKVLIRDCQVNKTFELSEILWRSTSINFLRTDNLKLKENILELVQPNKPNLKTKERRVRGFDNETRRRGKNTSKK